MGTWTEGRSAWLAGIVLAAKSGGAEETRLALASLAPGAGLAARWQARVSGWRGDLDRATALAAENGREELLRALLPWATCGRGAIWAAQAAAARGSLASLRIVMEALGIPEAPVSGRRARRRGAPMERALREAALGGHAECVRELLARGADASFEDWVALRRAAGEGRARCVGLLLASSGPSPRVAAQAVASAAFGESSECVSLLLPWAGADEARATAKWLRSWGASAMERVVLGWLMSQEERRELEAALGEGAGGKPVKRDFRAGGVSL